MTNRILTLNLRVREEDRRKAQALAEASDEPLAQVMRRLIRQAYATQFGETEPPRLRRKRRATTKAPASPTAATNVAAETSS